MPKYINLKQWEAVGMAAGLITQLRRDVKPPISEDDTDLLESAYGWDVADNGLLHCLIAGDQCYVETDIKCPYGQPGVILLCRETWGVGTRPCPHNGWVDGIEYKADLVIVDGKEFLPLHVVDFPDGFEPDRYCDKWQSPVTAPLVAIRHKPTIASIRVERAGEIVRDDVFKCGLIDMSNDKRSKYGIDGLVSAQHPIRAYSLLYDTDHGPGAFAENRWQWVIELEKGKE